MVSTRDTLTLIFVAYAVAQIAPSRLRNIGMTDESDKSAKRPSFPGENPPEHELERWRLSWVPVLREKHLLAYADKADPERLTEYRPKADLAEPGGASDALKASIQLKNAETANANARLAESWTEHKRSQNDEIGALLQVAMMPTAKLRFERLAAKHKYAIPHDHMINGGAIWRELLALKGTLEKDQIADRCFNAYALLRSQPLPSNATTQQFADRFVEFDVDINPHLEVKVAGVQYVKLLLSAVPTDLGSDKRSIERDLEAASLTADPDEARKRISSLLAKAHVPLYHIYIHSPRATFRDSDWLP